MKKMSIRRRIAVTRRGFAILKRYCPGLAQGKAVYELIHSLQPFFSIWFSARILNELSGQRRLEAVVGYVAGILLLNFLCAVCKGTLDRFLKDKETQMWNWFGKIFADKQMALDFVDLENAKIQQQRQEAEENLYMFGNGLAQLVWGTATLVRATVNLLASFLLTVSLFTSRAGNAADHPVWIFLVLTCIALGGLCNGKATVKENAVFMKWCEDTVWFNRVFMFFGRELYMNPEKAKDVRLYGQDVVASGELEQLLRRDRENQKAHFQMAIFPAMAGLAIGLANAMCYLFVVIKAFYGAFGVGSIVQYVAVLSRLGDGLQEWMYILSDNEVYCIYLQKLFDYLDLPNHMYQGSLTVEKRDDNEYGVEFRDVSFRYPNTDTYVLRHVNLKFRVGEKLAVVGMNGSGKTTFIKLLCRLYDPTEGEILLNGVNIKKYDYGEYQSIFSVVFQDFQLFPFSLGQNVAAGASYDAGRVRRCLVKAGFEERLEAMPDGVKTWLYRNLNEAGVEISGGEAQKIALARALYRDAPFIILDEPTAALDPVSEYEVYSRFSQITGDKTAVYISHRLASCRFCDRIAVFHEGAVLQMGTHEELLADEGGKYQELWHAQAQYYA